ncbi:MAG: hypothetical protein ACP5IM_04895 [Candidatus Bathyarchaeia archaeon]|nr:MAG: hypothetical protein C0195_00820 [Candidatus Bathyarchaeota archaeon]
MPKNFKDKITLSGTIVLMVGVALLIFTFISAWSFLTQNLQLPSGDFTQMFGEALGPLIAACIRIMYLGVMGWIGSLVTIRGVTLLTNIPKAEAIAVAPQKPLNAQQKHAHKEENVKEEEEAESPEPQMIVIPPEQAAQQQVEGNQESEQQQRAANS